MVQSLHVHRDDDGHARHDLAHVIGAHDDEPALDELGSAGIHDGDARSMPLDRLLDLLVPDRVSGKVEVAEHEATDGREKLRDASAAVARRCPRDREAVPRERVLDGANVKPERAKRLLVLRLAEDRHVARQQFLRTGVEVVSVTMRDDHGVEPANDLLAREWQGHRRVRNLVAGLLDRWSCTHVVEHRIDEDALPFELEYHRRAANERDAHGWVLAEPGWPEFALHPAILRDPMANDIAEKPAAAEAGVWITGPDGDLIPDYDAAFPEINEGEVVHGTVVRVDKDEVLVDIGYKSEGVIPVAELTIRRSVNPADEVAVGEEIDALVLTKEDAEGRLILSKKRARFELAWKRIEAAAESGEPVNGKVIEVVKGGLILDLGVRGFLPASLVDIRRVQDLDEFLGKELRCKVIELNRSRNNVVLSRRAVLEDERKEMRQAILDRLSPGDVIEGQISNIVDFGAFVDLDGMDGLIHISELSWSHVNHPSEVLDIGQTVKVKVLDIDRDRQRISLGLKQTQTDPWQQVVESYREDDVVEGRVAKVVTFGAFVEILPGVEGLVHISELAAHHVENPREVVSQGDAVNVRVLEIDGERRRLSLSLKRVEEGDEPVPRADGAESVHTTPDLRLSEEAFPTTSAPALDVEAVAETEAEDETAEIAEEVVAEVELEAATELEETAAEDSEEPFESSEPSEEVVAEVELEEPAAEDADEPSEDPALEVGSERTDSD